MRLRAKLALVRIVLGTIVGLLGLMLVGCTSPTAPAKKADPAECVKVQADPNAVNPIVLICRVE